jgi:basic membrane lipoprotein Med (substrate-binding protein (PBP1-ABC) superfamily)
VTFAAIGCGPRAAPEGFRVALVTPGSIADAAWNSGAYAGLIQVRDSLGVPVSHIEARTPAEQEEALRTYAAQGYSLIFGHGFEFQAPAERISAQYPNPVFIVTSGERAAGKVVPLVFRLNEASFLAGMIAGGLTRTDRIGFIGGVELPPVRDAYEAWVSGARAVNPRVESRLTYLNNWDDAAMGREAAMALIRAGADMLHHNADAAGIGVFQAARESPSVYVFGANADQAGLAPERVIGSAVIDLPRAFVTVAREARAGTLALSVQSFGLASGVVRWVPNPALDSLVPPALREAVRAAEDSISRADGRIGRWADGPESPEAGP